LPKNGAGFGLCRRWEPSLRLNRTPARREMQSAFLQFGEIYKIYLQFLAKFMKAT
jgi:hypothetical protein